MSTITGDLLQSDTDISRGKKTKLYTMHVKTDTMHRASVEGQMYNPDFNHFIESNPLE